MSLLNEIRIAQRDVGEQACIRNLERMGLVQPAAPMVSISQAELDSLQADAARYGFIRANGLYHLQFERGECGTGVYLGAAADQAIDAAIKEAKP